MNLRWRVALVAVLAAGCSSGKPTPKASADRIKALEAQVEAQRVSSEKALADYRPKVQGRLENVGGAAPVLLRQLPGVAQVEVLVAAPKPTHVVVHIRDWLAC